MNARTRAEAEFVLGDSIKESLPPAMYEVYATQRERIGRWLAYQEAVISTVEWAATQYAGDPAQALAAIRAKVEEYNRAAERLGQTLDADAAIPQS